MKIIKFYFFILFFTSLLFVSKGHFTTCTGVTNNFACYLNISPLEKAYQHDVFKTLKSVERMLFNLYIKLAYRDIKYLYMLNSVLKFSLTQEQVVSLILN